MEFEYKGNKYRVEVIRKKENKNTYLRVKSDLTLYITTNRLTSDKVLFKMIQENKKQIEKMFEQQIIKQKNNEGFCYLGKKYDVIYMQGKDLILGENKVFVGKELDLDKWYKNKAKKVFKEHLDSCYKNFTRKIPYPALRIRRMTSRWGVCNYKDITVTLNLELIKKDISFLDYVIYHELSHLVEHNHSSRFWSVVEENCMNYKEIRKLMKDY